jgi:hypothetical protein
MNSRNNPIARIVGKLQQQWYDAVEENPGYKLIRWLIKPEDAVLVNGFYKLESSPYGSLPEFFIVMLTPFNRYGDFSKQLLSDWITLWENDTTVKTSQPVWDVESLKDRLATDDDSNALLRDTLVDFQKKFCREDQSLVFGLLPQSIADMPMFNYWIIELAKELPENIKLSFVDHAGKNWLNNSFNSFKKKTLTLECNSLNLHQAVRQITASGDENNPEAGFYECVFEMADGVVSKDSSHIDKWGKKAVDIALRSGLKSFMATAYLIYGGFLMQLKKDEADALLDKGVAIAENGYKNGDTECRECMEVLLQLYGYKSAYQSIRGHKAKASRWALLQARLAVENNMGAYAISICRMAARISKSAWEDVAYAECLQLGYHAGDTLPDDILRTSEIKILAYHYAKELRNGGGEDDAGAIGERMKNLFGEEWDKNIPSFSEKYAQTMPDIKESMERINFNTLAYAVSE